MLCSLHSARMMLRYFYNDFEGAAESAAQAEEGVISVAGFVTPVLISMYQGLALLGCYAGRGEAGRAAALEKVDAELGKLRVWADAAPMNNQHKHDLVAAEKARVLGDQLGAMKLYEAAISGAHRNGYVHEEGLACERAAELYDELGNDEVGRHYRTLAYAIFRQWGAAGKCEAMAERYPYVRADMGAGRGLGVSLTPQASTVSYTGALDLLSVVKASQALAGEIVQAKLLQKLMRIVTENVGAERGVLMLSRPDGLHVEAQCRADRAEVDLESVPLASFEMLPARLVHYVERTGKSVVLFDAMEDPQHGNDPYVAAQRPRSVLCAPIEHQGKVTGVFYFENNLSPGAFTPERSEVLSLLSAQVSISIENAKLYAQLDEHNRTLETKVEQRTEALQQANGELRTSLDKIQTMQQQIIVQEKLASLGTLTAGIAHELQNPLNFINNFSSVSVDLAADLVEVVDELAAPDQQDTVSEAKELVGDIKSTNEKIHSHGTRAANIIRNMLAHAANKTTEREPCDLNELVDSAVKLAFHGAKAKDAEMQLDIVTEFDESLGEVVLSRADMSRVIINIVNNACYATNQKSRDAGEDYRPSLEVATKAENGKALIRVRDNGPGIPNEVVEKVFNPFFTTKPTGEGTGLGMSLSYDIVVHGHQGELKVDTRPGEYTEFAISLPRA